MPLSSSPPTTSPRSHRRNKAAQISFGDVFASSRALQHQMSLSDMSLPSLKDNHRGPVSSWLSSEISLIETLVDNEPSFTTLAKPLPKIPIHEDFPGNIWSEPSPSRCPPVIPTRGSSLSPLKQDHGLTNLPVLSSTPSHFLESPSPPSSRYLQRPRTANADPTPAPKTKLKLKRQASYLAFPPQSTRQHQSWSPPQAQPTEQLLLRPRANTTPLESFSSRYPSNLSTCTTLSPISSPSLCTSPPRTSPSQTSPPQTSPSQTSPPQTPPRSTSPTNHIHSHPTLTEFISQQSFFFHEDDEDCSQEKSWFAIQRRRWLKLTLPNTLEQLPEDEEQRGSDECGRMTPSQAYHGPREGRVVGRMRKKSTAALRDFFMGKK